MKCDRCGSKLKCCEGAEIWDNKGITTLCGECDKELKKILDDFLKTKVKREKQ